MNFQEALHIQKGVTALIGSGGKSTLLQMLAWELRESGTVLLCTTTKMYPIDYTLYDPTEEELQEALAVCGTVCVGAVGAGGKLTAPTLPIARLAALADYVLVEADGAAGLPLKAHGDGEPVVPPESNQTICVVGLSGVGQPICEVAHRAARYGALAGADLTALVTPAMAARVLTAEHLCDRVLLNQADSETEVAIAREIAAALTVPTVIGALEQGTVLC
ncbi:MAG: selenium cofactor biosynthesis protein YqeC [Oscillospiraceae bacterium]